MQYKGIYSRNCFIRNEFIEATIYFHDGLISKIQERPPVDFREIYNAADLHVMPGVIDAHVHVNEPGRTDWEGFDTATQAAAAGGITTIVDMPLNASPVTTSRKAFDEKLVATMEKLHVNCGFYGGLVPGNQKELTNLIDAGVLGIKTFLTHSGIDEFPNISIDELETAMPLIAQFNVPLLAHCELSDADHANLLSQNPTSYAAYLSSRPKEWENKAVQLMISLCRKHNCPVHIVHVSSDEALSLINSAKAEGLPLTAETCTHYIYFNAEEIPDAQTIFKCAPPIREKENNDHLKQALANGLLNFIASDHSPAPPSIKEMESGNLQKAWGGIAGLQFLLSASWTAMKEEMNPGEFIPLLTQHPAEFLQVHKRKGFIKEGFDADITIWAPWESFVVKEEAIFHKHKISPYVSHRLFGKIHSTFVNGKIVFENDRLIHKNQGKWLLRK
jgi:allantoinase